MNSTEDRRKDLRKFGLLVGTILIFIGTYPAVKGDGMKYYLILPGAVLWLSGFLYSPLLAPVYAVWMKTGHILGRINSFILLSVIFYAVVTPMRLMHMLLSKEKKFGFRTNATSYWIKRSPEDFSETMKRQF